MKTSRIQPGRWAIFLTLLGMSVGVAAPLTTKPSSAALTTYLQSTTRGPARVEELHGLALAMFADAPWGRDNAARLDGATLDVDGDMVEDYCRVVDARPSVGIAWERVVGPSGAEGEERLIGSGMLISLLCTFGSEARGWYRSDEHAVAFVVDEITPAGMSVDFKFLPFIHDGHIGAAFCRLYSKATKRSVACNSFYQSTDLRIGLSRPALAEFNVPGATLASRVHFVDVDGDHTADICFLATPAAPSTVATLYRTGFRPIYPARWSTKPDREAVKAAEIGCLLSSVKTTTPGTAGLLGRAGDAIYDDLNTPAPAFRWGDAPRMTPIDLGEQASWKWKDIEGDGNVELCRAVMGGAYVVCSTFKDGRVVETFVLP